MLLHLGRQRAVIPYCVNEDGCGPTWGNSLFEDPAEFTYGMFLGQLQQRQVLVDLVTEALETDIDDNLKAAMQGWLENMKDADGSKRYGDQVREMLFAHSGNPLLDRIERLGSYFTKRSYWIFVGDGSRPTTSPSAASTMCWPPGKTST
jgi:pyruvate-ferredoxin/flavodoxin oxidoreductase